MLQEERQKELEAWAIKHPFAAYMLFTKDTFKQKVAHAESLFS